jgi:RND family efflux transporter MFP subunit
MEKAKTRNHGYAPSRQLVLSAVLVGAVAVYAAGALAQPAPVPTMVVRAQPVGAAYELDGIIQPVKQSILSAQASGRVASLAVKAGDKVRAGQVLAVIDDRETTAGVQRSQAQVAQADAELRNASAQLERTRDLQRKGFVSQAALDTVEAQYKGASAGHAAASAAAVQSTIAQGFTRVTAPYDGWVQQTHVEAGDLAVPGKPLVTVYAPQPLRAVVQVPASRASAVRSATQTQVQMAEQGSGAWVAPVARSAVPVADPVSQTAEWRFELAPQHSAGLVPGQQTRVRFSLPQGSAQEGRLLVPASAIVRRGELTAVYAVANGAFALRAVRLGTDQGASGVEVLTGIQSGDVIALDAVRAGMNKAAPAASASK